MSNRIDNGFYAHLTSVCRMADGRVSVSADIGCDGECESAEFVLTDELFRSLELSGGSIPECICEKYCLLREDLEALDFYASVSRAYISACASFAYSPGSYRGLLRKLVQKGFSRAVAEDAVELVRKKGFVDEESIARRRAELLAGKLWGRAKILSKLREEGFDAEAMSAALEYLGEVDFAENCAALIRKKYGDMPNDRREREKLYASLSRMGYSSSDIKKAAMLL